MTPGMCEARGDPAVAERGAQELTLHRASVRPVVAAAAFLGLEVDGAELARRAEVGRGQDLAGAHVDPALVRVRAVEALVEHAELVAATHRAGEIDVPGEDLGEVVGQLALLAELDDGGVEVRIDHAGDPGDLGLELDVVAEGDVVVAVPPDDVALQVRDRVAEVDEPALGRGRHPEAVAGLGAAEVEEGAELHGNPVGQAAGHAVALEGEHQDVPVAQLAAYDHEVGVDRVAEVEGELGPGQLLLDRHAFEHRLAAVRSGVLGRLLDRSRQHPCGDAHEGRHQKE